MHALQINLFLGWLWVLLGFVSGMALGTGFHREDWLGGYDGLKRRLYRLAHISFFGLGAVNLLFYLSFRPTGFAGPGMGTASWALVVGALTMPLCCVLMAHFPRCRLLFSLPVGSLLFGGVLTLLHVLRNRPA